MDSKYEETLGELEKKAAWIEGLEYTTSYEYTTQSEDTAEYFSSATKRLLCVYGVMSVIFLIILIVGLVLSDPWVTALGVAATVFFVLFLILYFINIKKAQKRKPMLDEVKFSFNAYGIVMRVCNARRYSVYAYEWNDFEQIIEYKRVVVGIKEGIAYIFPKRIFSSEEFERFRKMSFDGAGKKCLYKNFKPSK